MEEMEGNERQRGKGNEKGARGEKEDETMNKNERMTTDQKGKKKKVRKGMERDGKG